MIHHMYDLSFWGNVWFIKYNRKSIMYFLSFSIQIYWLNQFCEKFVEFRCLSIDFHLKYKVGKIKKIQIKSPKESIKEKNIKGKIAYELFLEYNQNLLRKFPQTGFVEMHMIYF
jgi:hypothetical protein